MSTVEWGTSIPNLKKKAATKNETVYKAKQHLSACAVESRSSSSSLETHSESTRSDPVVAAQRFSSIYVLCSHSKNWKWARLIDLRLVELFYREALMTPTNESQIVMNGAD